MSAVRGPLTFGQTSMWRGIMDLSRDRWPEVNLADVWPLPVPVEYGRVRDALAVMAIRHPTLRTTYDFDDPRTPLQCLHPVGRLPVEMLESPAENMRQFVSSLAAKPISLHKDYGWSAYVITRRRIATHFAMVFHHMTADGMGIKIFWDELVSLLRNGSEPSAAESNYDLIQLAIDQRQTPARQARQQAAARHWHATLTTSSHALSSAADDSSSDLPVLLVRLHSRRSRAAASKLAGQTRTSVAAVLLAAYARAIAEVQGVQSIPMRVLSSNRYERRWEQCVTSLNQWAPLHIDVGTESFGELAVRSHTASLLAYLHGMFDPDAVAAICAQYPAHVAEIEHVWAINYIPATPSRDHGTAQADADGQLTWEPALRNLGARFYLRAVDREDGTWTLQLRTRGIDQRQAGALIQRVHYNLISEAARLDIA
jgi:Condensation domain